MSKKRTSTPPPDTFWVADHGYRPCFRSPTGVRFEELSESFYALIEAVSTRLDDPRKFLTVHGRLEVRATIPDIGGHYPHGTFAALRAAPMAVQKALNDLWARTSKAIDATHKAGLGKGKNIVVGLADGTLKFDQ